MLFFMRGFIVHPTYETDGKTTFVLLQGRLENGESFIIRNEFKPYFYIRKKDVQKALGFVRFDYEETENINFDKEDVVKLTVDMPKEMPELRRALEGIPTYESDIRYQYRYMIDHDLQASLTIPKSHLDKFEKGERVDRLYHNIPLESTEPYHVKLKVLSFDIETDVAADNIFCISIVCS